MKWTDLTDTNEAVICENAVRPVQAGRVVRRFIQPTPVTPNNEVEVTLKVLSLDVGPQAGSIGRYASSGDGYEAIYNGIEGQWELRHIWGAETLCLGSYPEAIEPGMHTLVLRMKGDQIELLANGEQKVAVRDFAVAGVGQAGIMLFQRDDGEKMSGIHIDRFDARYI